MDDFLRNDEVHDELLPFFAAFHPAKNGQNSLSDDPAERISFFPFDAKSGYAVSRISAFLTFLSADSERRLHTA